MGGAQRIGAAALGLTLVLAGCGPVPVQQAERNCLDSARAAKGPRGEISVGVATDGHRVRPHTGISLSVSSDYVMGRDPADAFNRCVMRQSGQMPTRPLYDQPGWRG
ncbi:hypothetical protein [Paracoccus sanguinis]|uniref:Uncharacterized protein n=1 Tax=Paracoccus sanguinis TaxID=1545044 RepID=A0A1H2X9C6_9RHOB|nr:hypothetical protein [Paracoccus sanguinis]KGJ17584.1 hypothetical protein IX57_07865 [Paracoccus sanguinis]QJD16152.1 hypothetical protein HGN31_04045 [Paracoccus sanguinis]SDW88869.1 hypothetical protein SAMN05444276_102410 [Paracoccus sanguinis]